MILSVKHTVADVVPGRRPSRTTPSLAGRRRQLTACAGLDDPNALTGAQSCSPSARRPTASSPIAAERRPWPGTGVTARSSVLGVAGRRRA